MPSLPISGPSSISGGALPVRSSADVLALLPPDVRKSTSAPVRDALAAALTTILQTWQRRSSRGAAMSDVLRASGSALDGLGIDHEIFRQPGELDEDYRARILGLADVVTPDVIVAAVNEILAPFTSARARYFESEVDQWFVHDGSVVAWDSFVNVDDNTAQASPHYPDRLYPDDAVENDGDAIDNREVLGAWAFDDTIGRYFVLRIPQLEAVDDLGSYSFDDTVTDDGMFVANGTDEAGSESDGSVTSFLYTDQVQSDELYAAIVRTVEILKGQGIRWQAYVDALLT